MRLKLFILLLLSGTLVCRAQTGFRDTAFDFNKRLGRGINFMASKINQGYHDPFDFELIAKNKFTHVRIGSRMWQYTGGAPDFTIDAGKLDSYQNAIDWALDHNLMVVMDPIHSWKEYSDADLPKLKKLWEQIATRFKDYSTGVVAFEIFNEPWSKEIDLEAMIKGCINIIRDIPGNEQRIIIVSGQSFSTRKALIDAFDNNIVFPADDPFLIGTFHYYDPRPFTKQGEAGGVFWATEGNNDPDWDEVITKFREVETANNNWASVNNTEPLPIYNGEFGVDNGAPSADRIKWLWWIRMVSEQMGYSNSLWNLYNNSPNSKGFGPWNEEQKNNPATRFLDQSVLTPYRNRYETEKGLLQGGFIAEPMEGSSDDTLVSSYNGMAGDSITLQDVYIARGGTYDVTIRFQNNDTGALFIMLSSCNSNLTTDSLKFGLPPSAGDWNRLTVPLQFVAGENNRIVLRLDAPAEDFHIDYLAITKGSFYDNLFPSEKVEALPVGVSCKKNNRLSIYPNPATSRVFIIGSFNHWQLLTLSGTRLFSGTEKSIDVSRLKKGLYILKVDNGIFKIIIN